MCIYFFRIESGFFVTRDFIPFLKRLLEDSLGFSVKY